MPAAHCGKQSVSGLSRLLWQALDWLDYLAWDLRLRMTDALYSRTGDGSSPPPPAQTNSKASCRSLKLTDMAMLPVWAGDSTRASSDMSAAVAIFTERDHAWRQR
jgi:hypothetical protein